MDILNFKVCTKFYSLGKLLPFCTSKGFTIVENLVATVLVGISIFSITPLCITCFNGNAASRGYSVLEADVQNIVDGYKNLTYPQLLAKFGGNALAITHNQSANETSYSADGKTTYLVTLKAQKTNVGTLPEAVKVLVDVTQRRGKFGDAILSFETIIAEVN